ncbi:MAG: DUF2130 domain-containing protein [Gammaproteobacteria bacterium]|nr:DUF2130 domain-containing protein [Gammaproteobacteria bacterium]MBI5615926.1 DUF2130 domain-containing protein [Gammaproteobacteria bacterium]
MNEPTLVCPQCQAEIKLTESLAAPLIAATRREYEQRLGARNAEIATRERELADREQAVAAANERLAEQVRAEVDAAKARIAGEEAAKAKRAAAAEIEAKARAVVELEGVLKERDEKLAEAQRAQAGVLRQKRELDDQKRELELTVEQRVAAGLETARTKARQEAEDALRLKVAEKEQTITAMQRQIEELKRKAEQGSQQLQGEVQELELEALLGAKFPRDTLLPVPKGEFGGDVVQRVIGPLGQACGAILWESKRTKNWSDGWLVKLREDQRTAKAELCALVSQVLPKGVETFECVDGVWVLHPRALLPVATALRQTLVEVAMARQAGEGQQTKTEMVYQYLTGPRFKHRVEAIVEAFNSMREDLDRERKAIMKQWAKREEQIERVMQATVGMYGDLQGIAGRSLQEIEGLALPALEDDSDASS